MFVITADQRSSRTGRDLVPEGLSEIERIAGDALVMTPERTAGDEIQLALRDAEAALSVVLQLTRTHAWSVGVGVGGIEASDAQSIRAARGSAFIRARDAVERAKRAPGRVAVSGGDGAPDAEALLRLLVDLRDRRTEEGWEVHDLLAVGLTQREVAARLGISDAAVSLRAKAAALRIEEAAAPALRRILARLDGEASVTP